MFQFILPKCLFLLMRQEQIEEIHYGSYTWQASQKILNPVKGKTYICYCMHVHCWAFGCKNPVDGEVFYGFVQTRLLPKLMRTNPHSVVVLDNCAIHHVNAIVKSIEEVGALVYFLPPILNPIEELFSKVKTELKSLELQQETQCTQRFDLKTLLLASFTSITEEDCNGWIMDSEIRLFFGCIIIPLSFAATFTRTFFTTGITPQSD